MLELAHMQTELVMMSDFVDRRVTRRRFGMTASGALISVKGMARSVISTDGTAANRIRRMGSM